MGIAKNTGFNIAGSVIPLVVSIVTVPWYIKTVGVERYGVLALCWLILGFMNFLNLGMGPAVAQRLASLRDAAEAERCEVFWTAIWLNLMIGFIAACVAFTFAGGYFQHAALMSPELQREITDAIPSLSLMIPTVMLGGVLGGTLQGRDQFLALNIINLISSVLMSVLPLSWAILAGPDLAGLVAAALFGRVVALFLSAVMCVSVVPIRSVRAPVTALMGKLVSYGGWITITSLIVPIVSTIDRFIIGAIAGAAAVSVYVIPYNLVSRLSIFPSSLASALFPRFAAETRETAFRLQAEAVSALIAFMTPVCVLLIAVVGPFLRVWIGRSLGDESTSLAYILIFGFWMNSTAHVAYVLIEAQGRPDLIAKYHIGILAPYLIGLYVCLTYFGILGAAVAWSFRSFFDPTLFAFTGNLREIVRRLAFPASLVFGAMCVGLLCDWQGWPHWALLSILFGAAVVVAARSLPDGVRNQIRQFWLSNFSFERGG